MTDETPNPTAPEPDRPVEPGRAPPTVEPRPAHPPLPGHAPLPPPVRGPSSADTSPRRPEYRGEDLDPERGPGLGCFWFQVIVLGFFIVIIPVGLNLNWPFELLAILLFVVIGLLLLTGQTVIFLLRLVAADRRAQGRRRPLASTTKTVGQLEDEAGAQATTETEAGAPAADDPAAGPAAGPAADPAAPDAAMADDAAATVDEVARDAAGAEVPASDTAPPGDAPAADAPAAGATGPEEPDPGVRQ